MIVNPFQCEKCCRHLQPHNLGAYTDGDGNLIRICLFCGNEVIIKND